MRAFIVQLEMNGESEADVQRKLEELADLDLYWFQVLSIEDTADPAD